MANDDPLCSAPAEPRLRACTRAARVVVGVLVGLGVLWVASSAGASTGEHEPGLPPSDREGVPIVRHVVTPVLDDVLAPLVDQAVVPVVEPVTTGLVAPVVEPVTQQVLAPLTQQVVALLTQDVVAPLLDTAVVPVLDTLPLETLPLDTLGLDLLVVDVSPAPGGATPERPATSDVTPSLDPVDTVVGDASLPGPGVPESAAGPGAEVSGPGMTSDLVVSPHHDALDDPAPSAAVGQDPSGPAGNGGQHRPDRGTAAVPSPPSPTAGSERPGSHGTLTAVPRTSDGGSDPLAPRAAALASRPDREPPVAPD